jgi:hypothetical protein
VDHAYKVLTPFPMELGWATMYCCSRCARVGPEVAQGRHEEDWGLETLFRFLASPEGCAATDKLLRASKVELPDVEGGQTT